MLVGLGCGDIMKIKMEPKIEIEHCIKVSNVKIFKILATNRFELEKWEFKAEK
jgi:ribosomal protein L24